MAEAGSSKSQRVHLEPIIPLQLQEHHDAVELMRRNIVEKKKEEEESRVKRGLPRKGKDKDASPEELAIQNYNNILDGSDKSNVYVMRHGRFDVYMRNEIVVDWIRRTLTPLASQFMQRISDAVSNTATGPDDFQSEPLSMKHINSIMEGLHLDAAFQPPKEFGDAVIDMLNIFVSHGILRREYSDGRNQYSVDFNLIHKRIKYDLLQTMVLQAYGREALRMVSILHEHGKLEERHIYQFALMSHKEGRIILTRMVLDGILQIQELSRSHDKMRDSSKVFHFYYLDLQRVYNVLAQRTDSIMAKLAHRRRDEKDHNARCNLLLAQERLDVQSFIFTELASATV